MNLGEAVYKLIAGHSVRQEENPRAMVQRGLREAGGVSQLARAIGVSRTTVQRWNKGSTPTQASTELLRAALRAADLSAARAARLSTTDRLTVKGRQDGRQRTVDLGRYLRPGTMGRAVEAFMRGASPAELHVVVFHGITDRNYQWMFQPPGGFAQMGPGARLRATHAAHSGASAHGGTPGGAGGLSSGGGQGGDDFDPSDSEEEWEEEEWDDDLYDLAYEGGEIDSNAGYEFGVTSAAA